MFSSELGIVVMMQDAALSDAQLEADAVRAFSPVAAKTRVYILHHTKADRLEKLNAYLGSVLDAADCFVILDVTLLRSDSLDNAVRCVQDAQADILCACDPAPKKERFNRHRGRYVRYLCEQAAFWYFSEKAVRRMRTADTIEYIAESSADETLSIRLLPKEIGICIGSTSKLRMLRYCLDARRALCICAALALTGSLVFLVLGLRELFVRQEWNVVCIAGWLVCVHIVILSFAALLILWYRRSASLEQKAREHLYVEEARER